MQYVPRTRTTGAFMLIPLSLFGYSLMAAEGDQDARKVIENVVATHQAWGPKISTPGTSLVFQEQQRANAGGQMVAAYHMLTTGLPKDKTYSLIAWPIDGKPAEAFSGITIDPSGVPICSGSCSGANTGLPTNAPIELAFSAAKGEPKRIGLVSSDQTTKVFATIIPFPDRGTDGACTLEQTRLTPSAAGVILQGSGFKPGSAITLRTASDGTEQQHAMKADEHGNLVTTLLPYKKGVKSGTARVTFTSDSCSPSVSFAWGEGSYKLE